MLGRSSGAFERVCQPTVRANYAEKVASKQGFPFIMVSPNKYSGRVAMQNPRVVSELLQLHNNKLKGLAERLNQRAAVLGVVHRNLPPKLAPHVISAGLEQGRLTLGVRGGAWASRLRYLSGNLRTAVGATLQTDIVSVRIRVVLPPEGGAASQATAAGT
jgi:hypothetical protein